MIQCIKWELYKFLVIKKGILLLAAYFILQSVINWTNPSIQYNKEGEKEKYYSNIYYEKWGGYLSDEKIYEIENMQLDIYKAENAYNAAYDDFYRGKISTEEYVEIINNNQPLLEQKRVFEKFYKQYSYCRETGEQAYLIRTAGWGILFNDRSFNYFLIVVCIFIGVTVFSADYECNGLESVIKTTKRGHMTIFWAKIISLAFLVIILQCLDFISSVSVLGYNFRLADYGAPIQSVNSFGKLKYNITIGFAVVLIFAVKTIGLFYLAIIAALITVLTKKGYIGFVGTFFSAIIIYFLFGDNNLIFKIPSPIGFFLSRRFLLSDQIWIITAISLILICGIIICMCINYRKKKGRFVWEKG